MAKQKFKKNNINSNNPYTIEVEVQQFKFAMKGSDREIEKITFKSLSDGKFEGKDELKNLLENNESFELSFDDGQVAIIVIPANVNVYGMMDPTAPPEITYYEGSKSLGVEYKPDIIKIVVASQEETPNQPPTGDNNKKPGQNQQGEQSRK